MKFKDTLYIALLNYPMIYPTALDVYIHLFATIGNAYEWANGELVRVDVMPEKSYTNPEDAIKQCIIDCKNFHKHSMKMISESRPALTPEMYKQLKQSIAETHEKEKTELIERIKNTDSRMVDLSVRINSKSDVPLRETTFFYPLSKEFSAICNLPDDIKPDWLEAAETFYNIMIENRSMVEDAENTLPNIGNRIKELKNKISAN